MWKGQAWEYPAYRAQGYPALGVQDLWCLALGSGEPNLGLLGLLSMEIPGPEWLSMGILGSRALGTGGTGHRGTLEPC